LPFPDERLPDLRLPLEPCRPPCPGLGWAPLAAGPPCLGDALLSPALALRLPFLLVAGGRSSGVRDWMAPRNMLSGPRPLRSSPLSTTAAAPAGAACMSPPAGAGAFLSRMYCWPTLQKLVVTQ
jgi:hypothetical protein